MSKIGYSHYTIGRNFVKQTNYEQINTGRKKAAQPAKPITPMTAQELDTAYQYRQRAKREKLLRLADVNFEAGACVFVTLTFRENVQDYETAVKAFKGFTKKLRRKLRVGKQCNIVIEPHPLFFPHTGPLVKAVWYCTENRIDCKYGIKYQSGQDKPDICAFFHFLSHLSTRPFKLLPR